MRKVLIGLALLVVSPAMAADWPEPTGPYAWPEGGILSPNTIITEPNRPRLTDPQGRDRGVLSPNPYNPDSIANPYGRFGNRYSPESLKDPYNAGNPYVGSPWQEGRTP